MKCLISWIECKEYHIPLWFMVSCSALSGYMYEKVNSVWQWHLGYGFHKLTEVGREMGN